MLASRTCWLAGRFGFDKIISSRARLRLVACVVVLSKVTLCPLGSKVPHQVGKCTFVLSSKRPR